MNYFSSQRVHKNATAITRKISANINWILFL